MRAPTKYLLKNTLHGLTPGGFGYNRHLRQHLDPDYNHERDKHPVRYRHNQQRGWQIADTPIQRRNYQSYEEYTIHQAQKFTEILRLRGGFPNRTIVAWRRRFYQRFKHLVPRLPKHASILCLGARQGTEVEVLRDLGFRNAYGIDLNPGPHNPFVKIGDFMHLSESTDSIDCIYTNSVDHAFDLIPFIDEQVRIIKPAGYALWDLPRYSASRSPGAFEAIGWNSEQQITKVLQHYFQRTVIKKTEPKWQWLLLQEPHHR